MPTLTAANLRRATRILQTEGPRGLSQRAVRRLYSSLDAGDLEFPVLPRDVADSATVRPGRPTARRSGAPVIGWVSTPPALGSGGHTTMFRMIEGLEEAGIRCVLFLYDRHGGDIEAQTRTVRTGWPGVRAEIVSADNGIAGVDACFATSWESAHVVASRSAPDVLPMYFIQDYEPYFYPRGGLYSLAEDTYRFGFRNVALGNMVAGAIHHELGITCLSIPFGCDTGTYHLAPGPDRTGVVFYSKPDVSRRGYVLVRLALEEFHRRHPEQEIHAYGDKLTRVPFPVTWHGRLWPRELNSLYNRTLGGLAMSFTNISLVAGEMLSAGNIPVVNDSAMARADFESPYVAWARPTPAAIAQALCDIVEEPDPAARAIAAAGSQQTGWDEAKKALLGIVRDELGLQE